jgi:hypothetical protein
MSSKGLIRLLNREREVEFLIVARAARKMIR